MTQTAYTIDSANDTGQIDIFVDMFVSSFTYAAGEVTLSEIASQVDLSRDEVYFNIEKIREWLDLLIVNMPSVAHPQPAYSCEIEHDPGFPNKLRFNFRHAGELVLGFEYNVSTKVGLVEPRIGQILTLRAFSRYVEGLETLMAGIQLYKD